MPDYTCPDCGFTSIGWPTKKEAARRGKEHQAEHEQANSPEENDE